MSFELTTLGEYARVQGGYAYKSGDFLDSGTYPVLKIKNVRFGHVDYSESAFIDKKLAEETLDWATNKGDILISLTGSGPNAPQSLVGRVARVWEGEPRAWINQRVGRVKLKSEGAIHTDFLFYLLSSPRSQDYLVSNSSGSANQANISGKTVESLPCPKVDYEQSATIAKMLLELDEKILINRQINQTIEEIAQAIFKPWFVDFDPVKSKIKAKASGQDPERAAMCAISGKNDTELDQLPPDQLAQLRATADLFPDELIDSEVGPIPKGWEVKKIEDIIKRFPVGKKYAQKTASEKGQVPILDQGKSGIIGYHNEKPGIMASPDDPIVVFANHTCYMRLIMHDFSAIQNVLPFKGIDIDIFWIYAATYGKQDFIEYKGHWPDFIIKKVVVPNNGLDGKYGEFVGTFFKSIFQNNLQSFSLAELRDTLLPKLLSGEIELSPVV